LKELVQQYLSSESAGPWLLIVDNADDMDVLFGDSDAACVIADYLPESDSGLILFTTRSLEVAASATGGSRVKLPEASLEEAKNIFEKSLAQKDLANSTGTTELMHDLAYLPLAITQAAAYLNRNQVSVATYLQLLRGTEKDAASLLSRELQDSTRYKGSQNAVANTWLISFDQIRKSDSTAANLLSFISRIEPKVIPRSILPGSESEEQMVHAIGTLRAYAFVTERDDSGIYDMHSLVHLVTRIWVDKHGLTAQSIQDTIQHLVTTFPPTDYTKRTLWRQYLPHVLRIYNQKEGIGLEERYELFSLVSQCLEVDGQTREVVKLREECYKWKKEHLAQDHPNLLASQHELALAYQNNGQIKEAIELLEHVTDIEKTLAEHHPDRLASQHELVSAYRTNGQTKKAIELLEHVTDIRKTLAEDHPDRLASQRALASAYRAIINRASSSSSTLDEGAGSN
jgi:azurin